MVWNRNLQGNKKDCIFLLSLTILYSFIAFFRLGDRQAPTTMFTSSGSKPVVVEFYNTEKIDIIQVYCGPTNEKKIKFGASIDGFFYQDIMEIETRLENIFAWEEFNDTFEARFFEITPLLKVNFAPL